MNVSDRNIRFNTEPTNLIQSFWWRLSSLMGEVNAKEWAQIKCFIQFIGYPRSGHSLLGAVLNAHPRCGVSHELDALYYVQSGYRRAQLFQRIKNNIRDFNNSGRKWMGYNYDLGGEQNFGSQKWTHIGDKCGGRTTRRISIGEDPNIFSRVEELTMAKVKLFHVVRNPLDNISTMAMRTAISADRLLHNTLNNAIKRYSINVNTNNRIIREHDEKILTIYYEDFIRNTEKNMNEMFEHINLDVSQDWLELIEQKIWNEPNESRYKVKEHWTEEQLKVVRDLCESVGFLNCYSDKISIGR